MKRVICLFLASAVMVISMPWFSAFSAATASAATQDLPPILDDFCKHLAKNIQNPEMKAAIEKTLKDIMTYINKSFGQAGGPPGGYAQFFRSTLSKLGPFLAARGAGILTVATSAYGSVAVLRTMLGGYIIAMEGGDLTIDMLTEWIARDYYENAGFKPDDAAHLAEDISDIVDHVLFGAVPSIALLNHYLELLKDNRSCILESKARREDSKAIIDKGNQNKSAIGRRIPNSNHDRPTVKTTCWVYGPIGVQKDGTPIYDWYEVPC